MLRGSNPLLPIEKENSFESGFHHGLQTKPVPGPLKYIKYRRRFSGLMEGNAEIETVPLKGSNPLHPGLDNVSASNAGSTPACLTQSDVLITGS